MSKVNRRKFITATLGGAFAAAVIYGYYQYAQPIDSRSHSSSSITQKESKSQTTDNSDSSLTTSTQTAVRPPRDSAYLAVVHGDNPTKIVEKALVALGGIERFVKLGDNVIIKPNICVSYRSFEYAATTNPEVVGALTSMSLNAGAKGVRVMDNSFGGSPEKAYTNSGIEQSVNAAGGEMELMSAIKYREVDIPHGKDINRWSIYGDILDADVLINVPIAKHHSLARLTLGMKNLLGIIQNPNRFHSNLAQRIADLNSRVHSTLTVVDAVRILKDHGPTGGNLDDVEIANTVIASHDIVAADSYAATLFGLTGNDIPIIRAGAQMGLGNMDLNSITVEEIDV
ncbi:DUF362 domain-containing protein [[Eubacterium] cellulosolvens]